MLLLVFPKLLKVYNFQYACMYSELKFNGNLGKESVVPHCHPLCYTYHTVILSASTNSRCYDIKNASYSNSCNNSWSPVATLFSKCLRMALTFMHMCLNSQKFQEIRLYKCLRSWIPAYLNVIEKSWGK